MHDLNEILQSYSDDEANGEDLEYDPDFVALEMANQPREERVIGDAVIPAEDPDYAKVAEMAANLLGRTKDIRIAVILANAALRTTGLFGFEEVLRYIRACVEDHWDSVHPQLDEEDDNDPTMRVNAILGLTNRTLVLHSLRLAPLTDSRAFGRFSLRDLEVAAGDVPPPGDMENVPTQQTISAAFQDEDADRLMQTMTAAISILGHIDAISAGFDAQVGAQGPDLDSLKKVAFDIKRRLETFTGAPVQETQNAVPPHAPPQQLGVATQALGAINTPNDVTNALDRIVDYYARNEPSSPLPILLHRAKRLVSADFVTIMRDMAPLGVENVALIGGFPEEDEDD
jgi:type VI secretion system protein ImpA